MFETLNIGIKVMLSESRLFMMVAVCIYSFKAIRNCVFILLLNKNQKKKIERLNSGLLPKDVPNNIFPLLAPYTLRYAHEQKFEVKVLWSLD